MKVIYVAGPFTAATPWDVELNVRAAEALGLEVAKLGAMPLIPHTNTRFFHGQCTPEFWYEGTLELLKRCDAAIFGRFWQHSSGSRRELAWCEENKLPHFDDVQPLVDLAHWLKTNG